MSQHRGQALARSHTLDADLDALSIADKAALRLLIRADAATASQLARRIYCRERTAQDRLFELCGAGALERSTDPARAEAPPLCVGSVELVLATNIRL